MKNKTFYSNGKLLLSGEYVVLDGALSLAIPTRFGQFLNIEPIIEPKLIWESHDEKGTIWFEDTFLIEESITSSTTHNELSNRLIQILNLAKKLNPDFLNKNHGFKLNTRLEFPKNWGLGTSSTLINNIAQWANVDAYMLLKNTFGGSGYDIACAQNKSSITFKRNNECPVVKLVDFDPLFKEHLYFVHLNKKQNSRDGIKHYHDNKDNAQSGIKSINEITLAMINCQTLTEFKSLMFKHEMVIAKITKQTPVKDRLFKDFDGSIKSLGAWGGDFILVASKKNPKYYFKKKGYKTIIPYSDMIL